MISTSFSLTSGELGARFAELWQNYFNLYFLLPPSHKSVSET